MRGSMRQRGETWELRVYVGLDPVTNRKRYATKTMRSGKRVAQRELAAMVAAADKGALVRTSATVGELLEAWLEQAKGEFSPKTVLETRGVLDRYLIPGLGTTPLARLRADHLDVFYRGLRDGTLNHGRPLAPATIRRIHGTLRRALTQGVRWGWLSANVASAASPPRVPATDIKPPAPADVARLFSLASTTEPDLAAFVVVAAATGARRSEVLALRWPDVDFERGELKISRGIVMGPDGLVEKDTKTHQARTVALDPTTVTVLQALRERRLDRATLCGRELAPDALLFSHAIDGSEPMLPDSVSRSFQRLCKKSGLSGVRLHDLRHYVATRMLTSGVDVRTVAGRLGHRNAATTLNVYAAFVAETDRDAANALGQLFDKAVADAASAATPGPPPTA